MASLKVEKPAGTQPQGKKEPTKAPSSKPAPKKPAQTREPRKKVSSAPKPAGKN